MPSRSIDDLLPGTKAKWLAVKAALPSVSIFEVCTYRTQEEQNILFDKRPRVTWTRYSKHTERRAVDFALKAPNPFDLKADINKNDIPDFEEVGRMAEKCGLQWGIVDGRGVHKDFGHVQDNEIYEEVT
jgi:hypothetical protein